MDKVVCVDASFGVAYSARNFRLSSIGALCKRKELTANPIFGLHSGECVLCRPAGFMALLAGCDGQHTFAAKLVVRVCFITSRVLNKVRLPSAEQTVSGERLIGCGSTLVQR